MMGNDLTPANDNDIEATGVERCGRLLVMMAGHPEPVARFMLAVSVITDLSLQNDQDGFHIAADAAEDMLELEPWDHARAVVGEAGELIGFEGWPVHRDGLVAAMEQAVLEPTFTDRLRSLRALMMCAADEAFGDWGFEIAWFLNNRRLGRLRASEDNELGINNFEAEMKWRTCQIQHCNGPQHGPQHALPDGEPSK